MISEFHNDNVNITYDILTLDAEGNGIQYSVGGCGGWTLEQATKVKNRLESAAWNQDKTLRLVKRTRTETFELV